MANVSFKLEGREQTVKRLREVKDRVNSGEVIDILMVPARLIRDIAKRLVNRSSRAKAAGYEHLQDAIFATPGKFKGGLARLARAINYEPLSVIVGVDRKKAPHAHLVEAGHAGPKPAPAHPFLRPAADSAKPFAGQYIESGLRKLLAPFSR